MADEAQASEWQAPRERNRKGGANGWSQQEHFLPRWAESVDEKILQYPFDGAKHSDRRAAGDVGLCKFRYVWN